ncbi:MAG: UDP-glucose dehydrogenase family protein [Candidatus Woesearchaeota archaeon]
MKITMIGTGYVGLVTGTCFSDLGHEVMCVDIDSKKIEQIKQGKLPIYEQGLQELVARNVKEERLLFTDSLKEGIQFADIIFIAVGTPQDVDGSADLQYVISAGKSIAEFAQTDKYIVIKSTVPVGTSAKVAQAIKEMKSPHTFHMVSNPEFLREGAAIKDFMNPDRIVVGYVHENAKKIMQEIYAGIERTGKPIIYTDIKSAEIIKYAANAMLATRISFINMISQLCEAQGGNVNDVAKGIGLDGRIGPRFLHAGIGYGGSCFPKDVRALINTLDESSCSGSILKAVDTLNNEQRQSFITKISSTVSLKGSKIAVWGLAFKPRTDDMREAPSIDIIKHLLKEGAEVVAFDPVAEENAQKIFPEITFAEKPYDALKDCSALIICTEWDEFRSIDVAKVKALLKQPLIIDGRNIYDPETMKKAGITYYSIGRRPVV